jgi:hypothetical protein
MVQANYLEASELPDYPTELFVILSPRLVSCYGLTPVAELEVFVEDSPVIEYQASQVAPWLKARRLLLGLPSFIECQLCMAELFEWEHATEQSMSPSTVVWDRSFYRVLE